MSAKMDIWVFHKIIFFSFAAFVRSYMSAYVSVSLLLSSLMLLWRWLSWVCFFLLLLPTTRIETSYCGSLYTHTLIERIFLWKTSPKMCRNVHHILHRHTPNTYIIVQSVEKWNESEWGKTGKNEKHKEKEEENGEKRISFFDHSRQTT